MKLFLSEHLFLSYIRKKKMPKRKNYIDWDTYFMEIAKISAERSKDPSTQVGACLVTKNNLLCGVGYNGFPRGCSDDDFPWERPDKYLYVCHAEQNCLLNSNNFSMIKGGRLYTTLFPCNECAKIIIQLGVIEVIYMDDKYEGTREDLASKRMFNAAKVTYRKFIPDVSEPPVKKSKCCENSNAKGYIIPDQSWDNHFC